jgi:hypothetical protein
VDTSKPFLTVDDLDFDALRNVWVGVDVRDVGRLLRSHLVVEHFMNLHLIERNPHLTDFDDARLTFSQKLTLLGKLGPMSLLHAGIRRLNTLRNKVAHQLSYQVTDDDLAPLFSPGAYFKDFLATWCTEKKLTAPTPIDTIEAFANYATLWLHTGTHLNQKLKEFDTWMADRNLELAADQGRLEGERSMLQAWRESLVESFGEQPPEENAED